MQKKILSMILAIAMVISMFAGIAVTASAAEGTYVLTEALAVGDTVIMASADGTSVLTGVSGGLGVRADATPADNAIVSEAAAALTIEAGSTAGSIAFKLADGSYISWSTAAGGGNKLYTSAAIDANSSWTATYADGVFTVANVGTPARLLQYNSGNPRFCAYTSAQKKLTFYKLDDNACDHADATVVTTDATCTAPGSVVTTCACGYNNNVVIPVIPHNYVNGACEVCGAAKPDVASYKLITIDDVKAGNYIIAARRAATYPTVYPATASLTTGSNYDWIVSDTSVAAVNDVITADLLPEDAQIFVLEGNNTDGFSIGYEADGAMKYLGFSSTTANRKLAFGAEYATTLWTIAAEDDGFALSTPIDGGVYTISQNSDATSAIRGYKSGALYTGIYLFREEVAETVCEHLNTTIIPAVEATCTEGGNTEGVKCSDCGEITSGYEAVPALGHAYSYVEADGSMTKTCANCGDTATYTLTTISAAKADTEGTAVYAVKGIVTYVSGKNVYIEDATGALCVYFVNADAAAGIALGDELFVADTITDYNGLIETTNTTSAEVGVLSSGNALPLQEVTIAQLLADTTNEYLGERVIIKGATMGVINANGNSPLSDAEGNAINIYKATMAENVTENDIVDATVIVSTYNGYQLLVNPGTAATDVVVITEGKESEVVVNTIAEAKAGTVGEYYRIEGIVTWIDGRNVYVQDETGAMVVYLKANAANTVVGDKIRAYGALKIYNGLIELDSVVETDTAFYEILSNGNTVEAQAVTVSDLANDTTLEYHAEKIAISGTIVSVGTWSADYKNVDYTISDGTSTILVYRVAAATEADVLAVGTIVAIEGVVGIYKTANQVRVATMTVTGTCAHESTALEGAVTGDCVTDGYTGDVKCTVCGTVVTEGTVITAPGHDFEDGYCNECGAEEPAPAGPFYYKKLTAMPEAFNGTYIIVYEDGAGNAYVFNNVDAANGYVAATYANYSILGTDALAALESTIEAVEGGYAIKTPAGYIYGASGSNKLYFGTDAAVNTIEFVDGQVTITSNSAPLQFNSNKSDLRFRYYYKATQKAISLYERVEGEMPACAHGETVIKDAVDATCTAEGYTGDTYCALCFIKLADGTATDVIDHVYVDGICTGCGAEEPKEEIIDEPNLKFNMDISAGAEMVVNYNFMASVVNSYSDFYLEIKKNVADGDPIITTYGISDEHVRIGQIPAAGPALLYNAAYTGINAKEMGDTFETTLYAVNAEGKLCRGATVVRSIKDYLIGKLEDPNSIPELKTMAVDMLKYGAAAQVRFEYDLDNLVTNALTAEQLALATAGTPEAVNYQTITGTGGSVTPSIMVSSKVELSLSCIAMGVADPAAVKCVIKDADGKVLAEVAASCMANVMFSAKYDNVGAREMRKVISATFVDANGNAISQTLNWSIESYVAQVRARADATEAEIAVVNAMLVYGDSVAAYLTAMGQ